MLSACAPPVVRLDLLQQNKTSVQVSRITLGRLYLPVDISRVSVDAHRPFFFLQAKKL